MRKWTGELRLAVEYKRGKTIPKDVYFQGAFKVMRPHYLDNSGQVTYFLINPGGGYVDGDTYRMQVIADEKAELLLTTQSAAKVYKTPRIPVIQEMEFYLKKDSLLEYIPDPLIGYEDARYIQRNVVHMESGSTLIYCDILTPGWSPQGTLFSYEKLQLKNEIYLDNELVVFDHLKLEPSSQQIGAIGLMENYTHLGSMIVVSDKMTSSFIDELYDTLGDMDEAYKIGISQLTVPGFTVRMLANSTQEIEKQFMRIHQHIREQWFQKQAVFLRKY
ncbi:urease accessory protein UreD [Bacillus sp. FJAT-50079]|uniref:urease accessory protein UreD n=1 Tax=Bacillus sp. FJAT-50079 TaxID=2833577 RepID=UPI001BC99E4F|nr:urease accessory protein UreD [Bacillus sp. FJAT-50079]MBS4208471.1 urease accessory protein UreD [Bacillus sp. FJAT-50079]